MKKIVDGKKYDTETAHEVGKWENQEDCRDFHYFSETLYRKRSGEYFIHGEGGPLSRYAESLGDSRWGHGEAITPMTIEAAMKWAEKHLDVEAYEAEFDPVDDDEDAVVYARVSAASKARLRRYMESTGLTMSQAVERLIAEAPLD